MTLSYYPRKKVQLFHSRISLFALSSLSGLLSRQVDKGYSYIKNLQIQPFKVQFEEALFFLCTTKHMMHAIGWDSFGKCKSTPSRMPLVLS